MADVVSKKKRSEMMSGIRGKDTRPEMIIRKGLHALGYRFRLHRKDLPGKPDIVLPKRKVVIFVNGCFWHGHDCPLFKWPSTRSEFWRAKICGNIDRDLLRRDELRAMGWHVIDVWECVLKRPDYAAETITFLAKAIESLPGRCGVPHNRRVECNSES